MKPSWGEAPEWANWLSLDDFGNWAWHEDRPGIKWHNAFDSCRHYLLSPHGPRNNGYLEGRPKEKK